MNIDSARERETGRHEKDTDGREGRRAETKNTDIVNAAVPANVALRVGAQPVEARRWPAGARLARGLQLLWFGKFRKACFVQFLFFCATCTLSRNREIRALSARLVQLADLQEPVTRSATPLSLHDAVTPSPSSPLPRSRPPFPRPRRPCCPVRQRQKLHRVVAHRRLHRSRKERPRGHSPLSPGPSSPGIRTLT